jgi:hypothetical protein
VLAERNQSQVGEKPEMRQLGMGKMESQPWEVEVTVDCLPAQVVAERKQPALEVAGMSLTPVQAQAQFILISFLAFKCSGYLCSKQFSGSCGTTGQQPPKACLPEQEEGEMQPQPQVAVERKPVPGEERRTQQQGAERWLELQVVGLKRVQVVVVTSRRLLVKVMVLPARGVAVRRRQPLEEEVMQRQPPGVVERTPAPGGMERRPQQGEESWLRLRVVVVMRQ